MGHAEVISLDGVRARKQWRAYGNSSMPALTTGWMGWRHSCASPSRPWRRSPRPCGGLRQELTGGLTETIVEHVHLREHTRQQSRCPQCARHLKARDPVRRTVETLVGSIQLERPYFYCLACHVGLYPLDEVLGVSPGRIQLDVQKAAAKVVTEVPYDEAQQLFGALTGIGLAVSGCTHSCNCGRSA